MPRLPHYRSVIDRVAQQLLRCAFALVLVWWRVRRPSLRGASVAVWHAGRVLMIRNSYRKRLSLPGGGVGRREDLREAAVRELREEVGIPAPSDALEYVGEFFEVTKFADDHVHIFELRCAEAPTVDLDGREVIWADFMTPAQAIDGGASNIVRTYLSQRPKDVAGS